MTDEKLTDSPPTPEPIVWPSDRWMREFWRQASPETMEGALAYAAIRLAGLDGVVCKASADDLVNDAVLATFDGVIRWRPERVTLCAHLCDRISVMLRRERRQAGRIVQLEHLADDDPEGQAIERAHLSYTPDENAPDVREVARECEAGLWRLAASDQPVLACLNALAAGVDDDRGIADVSGLGLAEVRAARRRLRRMARALPAAIQERARSLLS